MAKIHWRWHLLELLLHLLLWPLLLATSTSSTSSPRTTSSSHHQKQRSCEIPLISLNS
jgi:hypothetical protein